MAVQVLTVLAYKAGEPVTSTLLADSVNTNPVVIRRLLLVLQTAGFVETRKGASVGSRLRLAPQRIDLAQVYRAVESGEPFKLPQRSTDHPCAVGHCIQAALIQVFAATEKALERELAKTSLAHILALVEQSCGQNRKRPH